MKLCDLHTHSNFSDGTATPAELIHLAEEAGLAAVALCDHNTVEGLPDFLKAAEGSVVEAVPGIEFSTEYRGTELHIVGLFLTPAHYGPVNDLLAEAMQRKEESNRQLVARLREHGLPMDYETIRAETKGRINRAVIGAYMVRRGICASVKEAFDQWLEPECGFYVPPARPDALQVIRFIKSIGAVAVLAHPLLDMEEAQLRRFLAEAQGLDGMEVYYSEFDETQQTLAGKIAEEFGLVKSGGSDFHGENKPHIRMGVGRGDLAVPRNSLEELKKRK